MATRLRRRWWGLRGRLGLLPRGNVAYNRSLWDFYSRSWDDPNFVRDQLDPEASIDVSKLEVVGDEWAAAGHVDRVVQEFVAPFVSPHSVAAEIGVGGGRVAVRVAPLVSRLICFDVSPGMVKRARAALRDHPNVEFSLLEEARLPRELDGSLDFIYAFDVFMHLDLHTVWK